MQAAAARSVSRLIVERLIVPKRLRNNVKPLLLQMSYQRFRGRAVAITCDPCEARFQFFTPDLALHAREDDAFGIEEGRVRHRVPHVKPGHFVQGYADPDGKR